MDDTNTDPYRYHKGLYVNLHSEQMRKNLGHWSAPAPNGQPRTIPQQFLELEREGVAGLYSVFNALVNEQFGFHARVYRPAFDVHSPLLKNMHAERNTTLEAWARGNGFDMSKALPYGVTFKVAEHQMCHAVMIPHALSEEDAARERQEHPGALINAGQVFAKTDHTETATAEEVGLNWVRLFTAEVRKLLGTEPGDGHVAGFESLLRNLKEHGVGTKNGKEFISLLRGDAAGAQVWAAFERCTSALCDALGKIADDDVPETSTTMEDATPGTPATLDRGVRIAWKGSVQVLGWLLTELAEKDWIDAPRHKSTSKKFKAGTINASQFTKMTAPCFNVNPVTLGQELKPEGATVPAQDVEEFKIPQRPVGGGSLTT